MNTMEIKKGDLVEITVGGIDVKGKRGKVLATSPKNGKIVVENLNMVKRHTKPRSTQNPGGIVEKPRAIDVSNVMVICDKCGKATRVKHTFVETDGKMKKVRVCKCGNVLDKTYKKQAKAAAKPAAEEAPKKRTRKRTAAKTEAPAETPAEEKKD